MCASSQWSLRVFLVERFQIWQEVKSNAKCRTNKKIHDLKFCCRGPLKCKELRFRGLHARTDVCDFCYLRLSTESQLFFVFPHDFIAQWIGCLFSGVSRRVGGVSKKVLLLAKTIELARLCSVALFGTSTSPPAPYYAFTNIHAPFLSYSFTD